MQLNYTESEIDVTQIMSDDDFDLVVIDLKEANKKRKRKILVKEITGWVITIFVAFLVAVLINVFVIRPSAVSGSSMEPTLHDGDTVMLSRLPYIFGLPNYEDIIVIDSNVSNNRNVWTLFTEALENNAITRIFGEKNLGHFWIKRVIGLPGDTISFMNNHVYRNGELLTEDYILEQSIYTYPNGTEITVSENHVFVMGDNRNNSTDSRYIGEVPYANIIGKMVLSW